MTHFEVEAEASQGRRRFAICCLGFAHLSQGFKLTTNKNEVDCPKCLKTNMKPLPRRRPGPSFDPRPGPEKVLARDHFRRVILGFR